MHPASNLSIVLTAIDNDNNIIIYYGFVDTPFGRIIIGSTKLNTSKHAICFLYFALKSDEDALEHARQRWPKAKLMPEIDGGYAQSSGDNLFHSFNNKENISNEILVAVRGTPFERQVWQTLVGIGFGQTLTYSEVAEKAGRPKAVRAAATAVGKNEVSLIIPCHRVVSKSGAFKYYWGPELKRKLLSYESMNALEARVK